MTKHTPTPWMTQPCGELLPDDVMIVADRGKTDNGMQIISTVARALSIRQTPEITKANAEFIVRAVNLHDALVKALDLLEKAEQFHMNCDECNGEDIPELCEKCFPLYDDARVARREALSLTRSERQTP